MKYVSVILAGTMAVWENEDGEIDSIMSYPISKDKSLINLSYESYKSDFLTIIACRSPNLKFEIGKEEDSLIFHEIQFQTNGALCTLALLVDLIPEGTPILVAPADGIVSSDVVDFVSKMFINNYDCGVITFRSNNERFSYARLHENEVVEIAEKDVIGELALTGVYYFRNLETLLKCISWSFINNASTDGVYFMSTAVNGLIANHAKVGVVEIDNDAYFRYSSAEEAEESKGRHLSVHK